MSDEERISVKIDLAGQTLSDFETVRDNSGIEANTEVIRHALAVAKRWYHELNRQRRS